MIKYLIALLPVAAFAQGLTWSNCQFEIDDDQVDASYKIYIVKSGEEAVYDLGSDKTISCADIFTHKDRGDYRAYATAYNEYGESEGTDMLPFVLEGAAPASPSGLGIGIK